MASYVCGHPVHASADGSRGSQLLNREVWAARGSNLLPIGIFARREVEVLAAAVGSVDTTEKATEILLGPNVPQAEADGYWIHLVSGKGSRIGLPKEIDGDVPQLVAVPWDSPAPIYLLDAQQYYAELSQFDVAQAESYVVEPITASEALLWPSGSTIPDGVYPAKAIIESMQLSHTDLELVDRLSSEPTLAPATPTPGTEEPPAGEPPAEDGEGGPGILEKIWRRRSCVAEMTATIVTLLAAVAAAIIVWDEDPQQVRWIVLTFAVIALVAGLADVWRRGCSPGDRERRPSSRSSTDRWEVIVECPVLIDGKPHLQLFRGREKDSNGVVMGTTPPPDASEDIAKYLSPVNSLERINKQATWVIGSTPVVVTVLTGFGWLTALDAIVRGEPRLYAAILVLVAAAVGLAIWSKVAAARGQINRLNRASQRHALDYAILRKGRFVAAATYLLTFAVGLAVAIPLLLALSSEPVSSAPTLELSTSESGVVTVKSTAAVKGLPAGESAALILSSESGSERTVIATQIGEADATGAITFDLQQSLALPAPERVIAEIVEVFAGRGDEAVAAQFVTVESRCSVDKHTDACTIVPLSVATAPSVATVRQLAWNPGTSGGLALSVSGDVAGFEPGAGVNVEVFADGEQRLLSYSTQANQQGIVAWTVTAPVRPEHHAKISITIGDVADQVVLTVPDLPDQPAPAIAASLSEGRLTGTISSAVVPADMVLHTTVTVVMVEGPPMVVYESTSGPDSSGAASTSVDVATQAGTSAIVVESKFRTDGPEAPEFECTVDAPAVVGCAIFRLD